MKAVIDIDAIAQPLWFVRSGLVYPGGHTLDWAGQNGYAWSSRSGSTNTGSAPHTDRAYFLAFDGSALYPSDNGSRYAGLPLRCIVDE